MSSDLPRLDGKKASSRMARRGFLLAGVAVVGAGALGSARWFNVSAQVTGDDLSAPDARDAALAGEITLVDIRRPDEWARTGIPEGGIGIDMRRDDFIDVLLAQTGGDVESPVALICARGVRSSRMSARLREAGFTRIIDVPEGMLGSGAGPGWVARGLPVVQP